ncbi:unknown [Bacteroides uniformis CAG:3]|nr:unknown [Bacteroides uniformis CAG:3]
MYATLVDSQESGALAVGIVLELAASVPGYPVQRRGHSHAHTEFGHQRNIFLFRLIGCFYLYAAFAVHSVAEMVTGSYPGEGETGIHYHHTIVYGCLVCLYDTFLLCIFPSAQTFIVAVADLNVICRFPKIGFQGTVQQLFSLDSPTHQSTGTFFYGEQGIGGYNFHRFGCLLKRGLPAVILQLWEFIVMIRKLFLGNFEALLCPRRGFLQRGIYIEAKFPTLIRS